MGKKCIPGVICVENMTLMLLVIISILLIYIYYAIITKNKKPMQLNSFNSYNSASILTPMHNEQTIIPPSLGVSIVERPMQSFQLTNMSTRDGDIMNDLYVPPMRTYVETPQNNINTNYQQVGILTKNNNSNENLILPLIGRPLRLNRNKWQYYTVSNSGNLNTKLPISFMGKSCTNEYGCDELSNGDKIYVEGYNNVFNVTIYENSIFTYM